MKKQFLLMLFALISAVSMMAADGPVKNEIWYTSNSGKIENFDRMGATSNAYNEDLCVYVATFANDVISIGEFAFVNCISLTSITLSEGVTSIGESAFEYCTSLTSITIPEGVTSIGESAFEYCTSLTSITIPEGVTSIGKNAFEYCYFTSEKFKNNSNLIGTWGETICETEQEDGLLINGDTVVKCRPNATSVNIPNNITSIGAYAFAECSSLTSITLPEMVTSIGEHAFNFCSSLTSITLSEGVTSIGEYAFYYCKSLTSITLPEMVTSIGNYVFYHCESLTLITLSEGVTSIGKCAFTCTSLTSITLPEGVTSIGEDAFTCTPLTSITLPEGATSIGEYAFANCSSLTTVICFCADPPKLGSDVFYESGDFNVFVITEYETAYKEKWSEYAGKITGDMNIIKSNVISQITSAALSAKGNIDKFEQLLSDEKTFYKLSVDSVVNADTVSVNSATTLKDVSDARQKAFTSIQNILTQAELVNAKHLAIAELQNSVKDYANADGYISSYISNINNAETINDVQTILKNAKSTIANSPVTTWGEKRYILTKEDAVYKLDEESLEFTDKKLYQSDYEYTLTWGFTYKRDFSNVQSGAWQCWYVPFDVSVSALNAAGLDVAEIAGILLNDAGGTVVAFKKMSSGMVKANTPYVVTLNEGAQSTSVELSLGTGTTMKVPEENSYYVLSMYDKFTFKGNYEQKHIDDCYTLNTAGVFQKMGQAVNLNPMRFGLTITKRDDGPYNYDSGINAKGFVSMMVLGDDRTTESNHINNDTNTDNTIFDMMGRQVTEIQSGHVYIMNGKTFLAK